MHRFLLLLLLLPLVVAAPALAVPASGPTASSSARPLSPPGVVRRFVAAVNARDLDARACPYLGRQIRAAFDDPANVGLDPRFPDSYTAPERRRACDYVVQASQLFGEGGWRRTDLRAVRFVARHGDRVHLRADVGLRFRESRRVRRAVADVFLQRQRGAWRIVSPDLLWTAGLDNGVPRSFAELRFHLRWLARVAEVVDRQQREAVRGYLRTRVPLAPEPLLFDDGAISDAVDPDRDAARWRVNRQPRAERPDGDLRGGALRTGGRELTFELRFRAAVPAEARIELSLAQGRAIPGTARWTAFAETTWEATLHRGWASAWQGDVGDPSRLLSLRASSAGDTLRLAFDAAELRDRYLSNVRLGRPFRWGASVTTLAWRAGRPFDAVSDELPQRQSLDSRIGVLHRP